MFRTFAPGAALVLVIHACASLPPPPPPRNDAQPAELVERVAAAERIASFERRDMAFSSIARDASASGHVELCLQALARIASFELRDATAAASARDLAAAGQFEAARRVAERVRSIGLRDRLFGEIAAGAPR